MEEATLPADLKKIYSLSDIQKWIDYGVSKGYVNTKSAKSIYNWMHLLKDLSIHLE